MERMIVEIGLGIAPEDSLLPMNDPDFIAMRAELTASMKELEAQGIMADVPMEWDVLSVDPDWAAKRAENDH
jgi:hypothetical protein